MQLVIELGFASSREFSYAKLNLVSYWSCTALSSRLLHLPFLSFCKEIQPVHPKGNQSWIFLQGLMRKLKLQYFGHLVWRTDSLENTDSGKVWRREETGTTEDEMVGWHHQLNGHAFVKPSGVADGQESLAYFRPWDCKESHTTEQLNWTDVDIFIKFEKQCRCMKIYE